MMVVSLIGLVTSFVGSMLSLIAWFHFDMEGHWQHRKHTREIKRGERMDAAAEKQRQAHIAEVREFNEAYRGN